MINPFEVIETIKMVDEENLDIRTITMGISLKSCAGPDVDTVCEKVYEKITTYAKDLVKTGEDIEAQFGIPIINKRISVTPIATLVDALEEPTVEKCVKIAKTLDKAAKKTGVNFIGGYTALVHKDYTNGERILIESIPEALAATDLVCSSVNVGSTRAGQYKKHRPYRCFDNRHRQRRCTSRIQKCHRTAAQESQRNSETSERFQQISEQCTYTENTHSHNRRR